MGPVMAAARAAFQKRLAGLDMNAGADVVVPFSKRGDEMSISETMSKAGLRGALTTLATQERQPGETTDQAFARVSREHPVGRKIWGLMRSRPIDEADHEPEAPAIVKSAAMATPAYVKIAKMAADLRKADPKLSEAQSIATVYQNPANSQLVADEKAERGVLTGQSNQEQIAPFAADREIAGARKAGIVFTAPLLALYREAGEAVDKDPTTNFHREFSRVMASPAGQRLYAAHRAAVHVGEGG